jgi:large subunit ribosomal protein L9
MATYEILLLKHVKALGAEGDQVKVKAGYARNFLFPNGIAMPLTRANKKQVDALKRMKETREKQDLEQAQALAEKLTLVPLAIVVKTGENGRMFGAVTVKEVFEHFAKNGIEIDRKKIHIHAPIKEIGRHKVVLKLHPTISLELPLDVVSENPIG